MKSMYDAWKKGGRNKEQPGPPGPAGPRNPSNGLESTIHPQTGSAECAHEASIDAHDRAHDEIMRAPECIPLDWRDDWHERAAVREFDGAQSRTGAETGATADVMAMMATANGREHECPSGAYQGRRRAEFEIGAA